MTLLHYVAATLARAGVRHAVIGAAAMAIRGVGRSTHDIDLLTLSRACLDASWWTTPVGVDVAVRRGDGLGVPCSACRRSAIEGCNRTRHFRPVLGV